MPPLLVHGAEVTVASVDGERVMPLADLFASPKMNNLGLSELMTGVRFPVLPPGSGSSFHRIGRRRGFTLSVVNAAAYIVRSDGTCDTVRIALGSVAPTPIRVPEAEEMLIGKKPTPSLIKELGEACKGLVSPVNDVRGSAGYRKEIAAVMVTRATRDAWIRAGGGSF